MFRNLVLGVLVLAGLLALSASGGEKIKPYSFGAGEEKNTPVFPAPELEAKSVYVLDLKEREIIFEKDSLRAQGDDLTAQALLVEALERGRPLRSGLKKLGVKDGVLHEILPVELPTE